MKPFFFFLLPLLAVLQDCSSAEAAEERSIVGATMERTMVWSDEFDGEELDTSVWNYELGDGCPNLCGWGNNEQQTYTRKNHHLADGFLTITARKEIEGYTSTRITTKNKHHFRYGRIEARAKLPVGEGLWPAFWMLGQNIDIVKWPTCGEIDILEYLGKEKGKVFTSLHTKAKHGNNANTRKTSFADIEKGFHRYSAEWTPESIAFFVDNQWVYTFEPKDRSVEVWPFDKPFYVLLNLAIGGNFGGPGIDESVFPQEYIIDYVRVYAPE